VLFYRTVMAEAANRDKKKGKGGSSRGPYSLSLRKKRKEIASCDIPPFV